MFRLTSRSLATTYTVPPDGRNCTSRSEKPAVVHAAMLLAAIATAAAAYGTGRRRRDASPRDGRVDHRLGARQPGLTHRSLPSANRCTPTMHSNRLSRRTIRRSFIYALPARLHDSRTPWPQ